MTSEVKLQNIPDWVFTLVNCNARLFLFLFLEFFVFDPFRKQKKTEYIDFLFWIFYQRNELLEKINLVEIWYWQMIFTENGVCGLLWLSKLNLNRRIAMRTTKSSFKLFNLHFNTLQICCKDFSTVNWIINSANNYSKSVTFCKLIQSLFMLCNVYSHRLRR